jgi:hypothetical protein
MARHKRADHHGEEVIDIVVALARRLIGSGRAAAQTVLNPSLTIKVQPAFDHKGRGLDGVMVAKLE